MFLWLVTLGRRHPLTGPRWRPRARFSHDHGVWVGRCGCCAALRERQRRFPARLHVLRSLI